MVFKHYRLGIFIVMLALVAISALCTYCFASHLYHWGALSAVVLAGISYYLLRQFDAVNRKLTLFLESIQYNDFTINFPVRGQHDRRTKALHEAFNNVFQVLKKMRAEKEEHLLYLNTVVQHIKIGIISYDSNGKISLYNTAACKLLSTPYLRNLHEINHYNAELYNLLLGLKPGQDGLLKLTSPHHTIQLSVLLTELRLRGQKYNLVALSDINPQLQQQELESWQNLTRVLRHEIMNSIAPVVSNIETINEILEEKDVNSNGTVSLSQASSEDIRKAFRAIERRSKGLLHFVDAYREFTDIPKPVLQEFQLFSYLQNIAQLIKQSIEEAEAEVHISVVPNNLKIHADPDLLEMVLINLIKNAIEASQKNHKPLIRIYGKLDINARPFISVSDNGQGISDDVMDKIFIPFYTTKKNGSGIGLSLSRQIMQMHGGQLQAVASRDKGSTFALRF